MAKLIPETMYSCQIVSMVFVGNHTVTQQDDAVDITLPSQELEGPSITSSLVHQVLESGGAKVEQRKSIVSHIIAKMRSQTLYRTFYAMELPPG